LAAGVVGEPVSATSSVEWMLSPSLLPLPGRRGGPGLLPGGSIVFQRAVGAPPSEQQLADLVLSAP